MGFFNELRRRKVTRVAAVYVVTAWVLLQVVDVVSDPLHLPDWFATTIAVTLIIGFPLAVLLALANLIFFPPQQSEMGKHQSICHTCYTYLDQ